MHFTDSFPDSQPGNQAGLAWKKKQNKNEIKSFACNINERLEFLT